MLAQDIDKLEAYPTFVERYCVYMDIGQEFLAADGRIPREIMIDAPHPSTKGYEIWAKSVKAKLTELRGN